MSRIDAIERFLALTPTERSPLSLLNITAQQCDNESIEAALKRRLDRIDRHTEGSTPDADTVRMALHAAAAQLNDPSVRSRILGEPDEESEEPTPTPTAAQAPIAQTDRQAQIQSMLAFRRTAIRTILLCRGWNRKSRRMLTAVAWFSGLEPEQMSVALRSISGPVQTPNGASTGSARPATPAPLQAPTPTSPTPVQQTQTIFESFHEKPAGAASLSSNVILGFCGGVAAVVIVLIVAVRLLTPAPAEPTDSPFSPEADASTPAPTSPRVREQRRAGADRSPLASDPDASGSSQSKPILNPPDPAGLVRTLRRCVELAHDDPGEAAWRFEQAVSQLSGAWAMLEPATLEAAHDAIRVFLLDAPSGSERSTRALNAISAGAKRLASAEPLGAFDVWPAVWSSGILAEIAATPGGSAPMHEFAQSVLGSAIPSRTNDIPTGFTDGAIASIAQMTGPLSAFDSGRDSVTAWGRWREALDATTRVITHETNEFDGTNQRETTTLDAIETLMRSGPSLAQRPEAHGVMTALLASVRWTPESASGSATPARLTLLRWFDDQSIETRDLALVTEWIVRDSGAPGIGIQMSLRRNAGIENRAALRDKYAAVWSLTDGRGADELATKWRRAATRAVNAKPPSADAVGMLIRAAEHGRLNEAAARRWRRESTAARIILDAPFAIVESAARSVTPSGKLANSGGRRDGAWSLEYLGANQSAEKKFAAISRLDHWGGRVGPIDGDVLARAALLGSPQEVRTAAQRAVRKRTDEPAIINGLLESISIAPKNDSTRALIEIATGKPLPSPRSAAWPRAARLALTEQLLEMLAGRSGLSAIDRIASTMGGSYRARAGESAASSAQTTAPDVSARSLWSVWRSEADRIAVGPRYLWQIETIEGRRRGRSSLAVGPMQQFAAQQASIAELMGYVIASERPSRSEHTSAVIDRMSHDRRNASSIFEQIEASERAMLSLWMIRFGEPLPEIALRNSDEEPRGSAG